MVLLFSQFIEYSADSAKSEQDTQEWLAHRFLEWVIAIQRHYQIVVSKNYYLQEAGGDSDNSISANNASDAKIFNFAFPYSIPVEASAQCFAWIKFLATEVSLLSAETEIEEALVKSAQTKFDDLQGVLAKYIAPSVNRFYLAAAAFELDIPILPMRFDAYMVGQGSKSRLFSSSITDETSAIGVRIAKDKIYSAELLLSAGLPAPRQARASNLEDAIAKAIEIGYPVVIKPVDEEEGRGVSANIIDDENLRLAFNKAREFSNKIVVEKHIQGFTHRLTVFNNKIVKVAKRIAGGVIGDGTSNIRELVDSGHANRRKPTVELRHGPALVSLDEEAQGLLKQQGLDQQHVPAQQEYIRLRRRDNFSAGGTNEPIDVSDIHPDNESLALRVADLFRLDFAGIDLIIEDITKSWLDSHAAICEVNAQPTVGISYAPFLYHELLEETFPQGGRIPIHLGIKSTNDELEFNKYFLIQEIVETQWLACKEGLFSDRTKKSIGYKNGYQSAQSLLLNSDVESALCLTTAQEIVDFGVASNHIDSICKPPLVSDVHK